jgi:hypothetical protein
VPGFAIDFKSVTVILWKVILVEGIPIWFYFPSGNSTFNLGALIFA